MNSTRIFRAGWFIAITMAHAWPLSAQSSGQPVRRKFAEGIWSERALVGGSVLLQPFYLKLVNNSLVLFDQGDFQLKAFSLDTGKQLWQFGRRGQGPWEISQLNDLQVSSTGTILLADGANARVTELDSTGGRLRMVPLHSTIRRILPIADGGFLAKGGLKPYWDVFDAKGNPTGSLSIPDFLDGLEYLAAEPINEAIDELHSAIAFRWSDRLILLDHSGRVVASGRGPERIEFPTISSYKARSASEGDITISRVSPDAIWAAFAVTQVGSEIWVLFVGASKDAGRLVDRFDRRSAAYLGSLRLPHRPIGMAGLGERRVAVLYDEPEPRVDVLTWIPRAGQPPR